MSDSTTASVRNTADKAADALKDAGSSVVDTAKKAEASAGKTVDAAAEKSAAGVAKAAAAVEHKAETVEKKAAAPAAGAEGEKPKPPQRSVAEIQAELDATRDRLAGRIDDLQEYVTPRNVANRQLAKVKGVFVDEFGGIKPDRVLIAAGVVVGLVVVVGISRRRSS